VIIRGVEEARRIFERMIGYSTCRITETIRLLLLFITLSVVVFGFYPVTPIMMVLLAILNDILDMPSPGCSSSTP
jgi:H+-transporting ATPase